MSAEIVAKGDDPSSLAEDDVGQKALRLLEIGAWSAAQTNFGVPNFVIAGAGASRDYYASAGAPLRPDYGPIPEPGVVAAEIGAFFNGFYESRKSLFDDCRALVGDGRPIYIGSSLALGSSARISFAGVNSRTTPRTVPRVGAYTRSAVENALTGLFRPYAELYLKGHGLALPARPAAIMFYEYIDADAEAVAYVYSDVAYVEWKPLREPRGQTPPASQFQLSRANSWNSYWSAGRRGDRVRSAMQDIMSAAGTPEGDIAEFEFCFTETDELFFLQYRSYPAPFPATSQLGDTGRGPVLGSVAEVSGRPLSLTDADVSADVVQRIVDEQSRDDAGRPIWLVNRTGPGWDAFRLLWVADYFKLPPIRLVMCHQPDQRVHPLHFTSVLREDPRVEFFGEMSYDVLRHHVGRNTVLLRGDGLTCLPILD